MYQYEYDVFYTITILDIQVFTSGYLDIYIYFFFSNRRLLGKICAPMSAYKTSRFQHYIVFIQFYIIMKTQVANYHFDILQLVQKVTGGILY